MPGRAIYSIVSKFVEKLSSVLGRFVCMKCSSRWALDSAIGSWYRFCCVVGQREAFEAASPSSPAATIGD